MTDRKIDGRTKRALDMSIAKRQISRAGYRAAIEGKITLQEAKELGRDRGPDDISDAADGPGTGTEQARSAGDGAADTPPQPVSRISKNDRSRLCICGCQRTTRARFAPGHDQVLLKYAYEYARVERELTEEQLEYVTTSGKLERAKVRVEREDRKAERKADS